MRKTFSFIGIFILLGLTGGFLRALELRFVFDGASGLPVREHPYTWALIVLSLLAALLALVFSRGSLPADYAPQPEAPVMRRALTAAVLNAFLLGASAALGFLALSEQFSLTQLVLAPLSLISAVTLVLAFRSLSLDKAGSLDGLYATAPIFWACFWLMLFFKDHAADPVLLNYAYELFSVVFLILALYLSAGAFFGNHGRRRLLFFSLLGAYFHMMCLLAPLFQRLFFSGYAYMAPVSLADIARHLFSVCHLLLLYWLARHHKTMFV